MPGGAPPGIRFSGPGRQAVARLNPTGGSAIIDFNFQEG
jgi:hypothetical protein